MKETQTGVLKGNVLGPLLFILHKTTSTEMHKYHSFTDEEYKKNITQTEGKLNHDFKKVHTWFYGKA